MRRIAIYSAIAAALLVTAVFINPAVGLPGMTPGGNPGTTPAVPPHPGQGDGHIVGDVVTLAASLSNTHILQGSDGELLLQLTVQGREHKPEFAPNRLPMNLAIVIDRSGSMGAQNKIGYARDAAEFLVNQLLPTDRVSLVTYDDRVQVLLASHPVGDGSEIRHTIRRIAPGGNTNLHGGMIAGAAQVERFLKAQQVNRVILISDGLANVGVSDTPTLGRIAQQLSQKGIAVTSMGVGTDYNEDLMLNLAEYSGGNYYYIDEPHKLAGIFEQELHQLVATIAQQATVTVTLAPGVQCVDVPGYTYRQAGNTLTIPLGDLPAGAQRQILATLRVPTQDPGVCRVATARLGYLDGSSGRQAEHETPMLTVERTENRTVVQQNRNRDVLEQNERIWGATVVEKAVALFEAGDSRAAQSLLQTEAEQIQARNDREYDSDALRQQAADLEAMADEMANAPSSVAAEGKDLSKRAKAQAYRYKK